MDNVILHSSKQVEHLNHAYTSMRWFFQHGITFLLLALMAFGYYCGQRAKYFLSDKGMANIEKVWSGFRSGPEYYSEEGWKWVQRGGACYLLCFVLVVIDMYVNFILGWH